jgi:hypothetical protein
MVLRLAALLVPAARAAVLLAGLVLIFAFDRPVAEAQPQTAVDLHLILAVDASGSVNMRRFELQKLGYVAAFRNPRVLAAVRSGPHQAIAVTLFQWTGPTLQKLAVPWLRVSDEASIATLATAIEQAPRQLFGGGTSISGAIDHAMTLFPLSPFRDGRRVIDISGDGANNRGRPATSARDEAVAAGVTINGLPVLEIEPGLDELYRSNVIGGPNAFMIPAETFEEFADAILRKLILEIAAPQELPVKVQASLPPR